MLPVLFKVGSFPIHTWGLLLLIGFVLAALRGVRHAPRYGATGDTVWDASLAGLFGGVIGGRLAFVAQNLPFFSQNPGKIFAIWDGGMTSFGGLIGGIAVGIWIAYKRGVNPWDAGDLAAVSVPIGYGIGRIGCLLNGCCYGGACSLPWAMHFHPEGVSDTGPVHPTQIYSAFAALVMYLILAWMEKRRQFRGQLVLLFCILYGIYRFIVEFWREGATAEVALVHLTTGQIASLVVALLAAGFYPLLARRNAR